MVSYFLFYVLIFSFSPFQESPKSHNYVTITKRGSYMNMSTKPLYLASLILGVCFLIYSLSSAEHMIDAATILFIFGPLIAGSCIFTYFNHPISALWIGAGIPLAISSSCIAFLGFMMNMDDPNLIYMATASGFVSIFWGGLASCIGAFFLKGIEVSEQPTRLAVVVSLIFPVSVLLWGMQEVGSIRAFVFLEPLLLVISPALCVGSYRALNGEKLDPEQLLQFVILGCLGAVAVALVQYYSASPEDRMAVGESIAFGVLAIFYSSVILTLSAFCSLHRTFRQVAYAKLNWHLLEIFSLWTLMCFAPMSLREIFV